MDKGLDALEKIDHTVCLAFNNDNNAIFNKDNYDHIDCKDINEFIECYDIIEKELKDYYEILEIAKYYHFRDLGHDVFNVETDRKWQRKFDAGIVDIQHDYRKARAFDIIKDKGLDIYRLLITENVEQYNHLKYHKYEDLFQEEYDLLRGILL